MIPLIVCRDCKHLEKNKSCVAFPKGIAEVILTGKNNHSKPLPDQENEIIFEARKAKAK